MNPLDVLKPLVGPIDATTLPSSQDWEQAEKLVGIKLPEKLKELISNFGHGTWGRDWVLFHPRGAGWQGIRMENYLNVRLCIDPAFQRFLPGEAIGNWSIIPIGLLPYRKHIF